MNCSLMNAHELVANISLFSEQMTLITKKTSTAHELFTKKCTISKHEGTHHRAVALLTNDTALHSFRL